MPSHFRRSRYVSACVTAVLATLLSACGSGAVTPDTDSGPTSTARATLPAGIEGRIDRVVDGDTVVLSDGARVRLIGIDTPESVKPDAPVECYGPQAADLTTSLLPSGTPVRLAIDRERFDRFGRTLAYLYRVSDGLFVNAALIEQGAARALKIAPNTRFADDFKALEAQARSDARGLWGACL